MYDEADDGLFGHDGRHMPLPTIALPARGCARGRLSDVHRRFYAKQLEPFEELFDAPASLGSYDPFYNSGRRFMLPTWDYGRIEADVFRENILLLPEEDFREQVCEKLNRAGYRYQIVGEQEFININKNERL